MLRLQLKIYDERRYNPTCCKVYPFNFPFYIGVIVNEWPIAWVIQTITIHLFQIILNFFKLFSIAMCKVSTSRICQKGVDDDEHEMWWNWNYGFSIHNVIHRIRLLLFKFSKFYPGLRRLKSDDWYVAVDLSYVFFGTEFHKIEWKDIRENRIITKYLKFYQRNDIELLLMVRSF